METPAPVRPGGEVARLRDQFTRAWDGEAWHGPPLARLLESIDDATAAWKPGEGGHDIQELASHITFWLDATTRRLAGELYLPASGDWDLPAGESWATTRGRLQAAYAGLLNGLEAIADSRLDEQVRGKPYSVYVLLHGALQHTLYHAGQIALLRRLAGGA